MNFHDLYLGFVAIAALLAQTVLGAVGITTIAGFAITASTYAIIGQVIIAAVLIGVSFALRPTLPKPNDGAQSTQQNIPPCQYGYGRTRIAGPYMFYDVADGTSYDVVALVLGKISGFVKFFLHDDEVVLNDSGFVTSTPAFTDGRYGQGNVQILTRQGLPAETAYSEVIDAFPGSWTTAHRGDGTASLALICKGVKDKDFQKFYPNQLPNPSAVIDFPAVWDPRDPAQSQSNPTTWSNYPDFDDASTYAKDARVLYGGALYISRVDGNTVKPDGNPEQWIYAWANPVLQLVDFITDPVHGLGQSATEILPVIDRLMIEANLCDELVPLKDGGFEPRYMSNGWYSFETDPAEVLGAILATCDGWMSRDADGDLCLTIGVYRSPTAPTISARHITMMAPDFGVADEESCNELTIKYTSPVHKYREEPGQAWRDEQDISDRGKTRSQNLQLTWVQSHPQARRLAKRTFTKLNAPARGSMETTLYGLSILGSRWIRMQYPDIDGLADVVVEITEAHVDFASAKCAFNWVLINPNAIDAWDPATEEGEPPPDPDDTAEDELPVPEDIETLIVGNTIAVSWGDPGRTDLTYAVQFRLVDDGTGNPGAWVTQAVRDPLTEGSSLVASVPITEIKEYEVQVASVGTKGTYSDWSDSSFADPPESETATLIAAFSVPPTDLRKAYINRLVKDLKAAGVWAKFDLLYLLAAHDAQAGRVNWVVPGTHTLTVTGSPVFTVDQGYKGAASSYLDTGIAPSALSKYKQNDAVIGIWSRTANVETLGAISASGTGTAARIIPAITATAASSYLNNGSSTTTNGAGGVGHHAVSRSASGNYAYYKNGASAGTASQTSSGVPTGNMMVLRDTGGTSSTQQLSLAYAGQSLNSTEILAAHNAFAKFLSAIGAI